MYICRWYLKNKYFAAVNTATIASKTYYHGSKLWFVVSHLWLVGSVGFGLGLVMSLELGLRVSVSVSISSGDDKPGLPPQ